MADIYSFLLRIQCLSNQRMNTYSKSIGGMVVGRPHMDSCDSSSAKNFKCDFEAFNSGGLMHQV